MLRTRSNHERDWPASGDRFWPYSTTTVDSGRGLLQPTAADAWDCQMQKPLSSAETYRETMFLQHAFLVYAIYRAALLRSMQCSMLP